MIDYSLILVTNYNGKQWLLTGNSYEGLEWRDESAKPTQAELDSQWDAIQTNVNQNKYKQQRAAEYPDFKNYLDGIVKGDQVQMQAYIDACLAVKAKYPKGSA
jgi:hypothetical protein